MFIVILIIMLAMFGLLTFYVAKKLHSGLKAVLPRTPLWSVLIPLSVLTLCTLLGFVRFGFIPEGIKGVLGVISACWMGIFLYLLLYSIASDIIALILKIFRLSVIKTSVFKATSTALVVVLTLSTSVYGFINARDIDHLSYEVKIDGNTDISDLKIALLSDLHLGAMGSEGRLEEIVDEINSLSPDLVLFAGDFFDTDYGAIKNPQVAMERFGGIKATYGVYACLGNHDAGETSGQMQNFLKQSNIKLLKEEYTVIDNRLILVGRLDGTPIGGFGNEGRKSFSEIGLKNPKNLPVIVMDHNPKNITEYNSDVDLIVCGHTHKGQIFPANLVTGSIYEVDYGFYRKDTLSPSVIVTAGIGYWGMPMRVGTNSEIVSISFKMEEN